MDLLAAVVMLSGLFLAFTVVVLVGTRRRAEAPFVAELPLPDEARRALREAHQEGDAGSDGAGTTSAESEGAAASSAASDPAASRSLSPGSHVPLVDALSGMDLPHGLEFLGTVAPAPGTEEVLAFATDQAPPDEVEAAVSAELERVGYELHRLGAPRQLRAERDDTRFTVTVHPPAGGVMRGKARAFPTTTADAVVVELSR